MTDLDRGDRGSVGADCRFVLASASGVTVVLSSLGARLVSVVAPDRRNQFSDVVLGYECSAHYVDNQDMYVGATIGRVAQRIGGARFTLEGGEYQLAANEGRNALHGGATRSFDKVYWAASSRTVQGVSEVEFHYTSPDLEEGYPGRLDVDATYSLTADGELWIGYRARGDRATPVNLTNHTYWNLAGAGSATILDHELTVWADRYTPTDDELIPTGEVLPVGGTPLDFRVPTVIGERIGALEHTASRGYDHNLVLEPERPEGLAARLRHPASGRILEVRTSQPCVQLYSGNLMHESVGKLGRRYPPRSALCLEPGGYSNALNRPNFPSIILAAGETYRETTRYQFLTDEGRE